MNTPLQLLCDTNVWLDNYLGFRPNHASVARFFARAAGADATLLIPVGALKDFYYLIQLELKRAQAAARRNGENGEGLKTASLPDTTAIRRIADAALVNLLEIATVVPADSSDVWLACKQRPLHDDFEDDLVIAAAMRAKADFLVTSDRSLITHAPIAALSPEAMATYLKDL